MTGKSGEAEGSAWELAMGIPSRRPRLGAVHSEDSEWSR